MYDVVILGSGPAGLTAGIYAARGGLKCALIVGAYPGGQPTKTHKVENYTGLIDIEGFELSMKFMEQAMSFGVEFIYTEVKEIDSSEKIKKVKCANDMVYETKTVIVATGAENRKLGLPNEDALVGKGVAYCATCDGGFYKDKVVAVNGGGNTAITSAIYLSNICSKVYLIHRRQGFRAAQILIDRAKANDKIEFILDTTITALEGSPLEKLVLHNSVTNKDRVIEVSALFVSIGTLPNTSCLGENVELNESGQIVTDVHMRTNLEGIFAAGDVRNTPLKQIITACADGAIAAESAMEYIAEKF